MVEKSKVEVREEFDTNAIKWGYRVGITDTAIAKPLYWCVLNIYNLQQQLEKIIKSLEKVESIFKEKKIDEEK